MRIDKEPEEATRLNAEALQLSAQGRYVEAIPLAQRAFAILEEAFGPDDPRVADALEGLALLHDRRADWKHAEPLAERALAIREKAFGPDHPSVAGSLDVLANLRALKGAHAGAELLAERALAIREKALGPDHPDVAISLGKLARLSCVRDDHARAEILVQRALSIQERALGPAHPDVATSLGDLAYLHRIQGDRARAEPLYQHALTILETLEGLDHHDVARVASGLAHLVHDEGDHARAEPLLLRALAIFERELGPDHPPLAVSLDDVAWLHVALGQTTDAVVAARRATDILDRDAFAVLATGSEHQKRLFMASLALSTSRNISLHVQHAPTDAEAARLALMTVHRRKGCLLDAMTDSLREQGAALRTERHLAGQHEVQAAIAPGSALVEIALYRPIHLHTGDQPDHWGPPRYVAYVLHPAGASTFADLGEAAPIDAAVEALRVALAEHDRTHDPRSAARALDRLVMEPIRELLGDTRWVFISPDGPLHLVPFGALVDENGHCLVERYLFSYLTTGRDLLRFDASRPVPHEPPLVLAGPAFDDTSAPALPEAAHRGLRSLDMVTTPLPPIDTAAEEACTIAQLFPDTRVLLGAQATEGAVKAAHAPSILHLATHGFFLPEQPVPEVLLRRGPTGDTTPSQRAALLQRENPLLRSGVALAGFNKRWSGSDDGVLTALEVAGLDLHGTRLAVLSIRAPGVGAASSGEGVYGLRRALVMAGAETQVMSLWQADAGHTCALMQAYYQRIKDGGGRSEAMRRVQLAMLANPETAHPNLWASFIVSGDWRTMEGEARLPEVGEVAPGMRRCASEQAGGSEARGRGGRFAVAASRRRRAAARGWETRSSWSSVSRRGG